MNKTQINKFRENYSAYHGPIGSDGLELACTFDEKDDVKGLGAKWNPAPNGARGGHWSMPAKRLQMTHALAEGTILEYLNELKMVVGPEGAIEEADCQHYIGNDSTEHMLKKPDTPHSMKFQIWEHFAGITLPGHDTTLYMGLARARKLWDEQCTDGYRPVLLAAQPTS